MTNYHPDVQRAYESHCADGYVVHTAEIGPQGATGATESDETRDQALGDGAGLREAVEALADEWADYLTAALVPGQMGHLDRAWATAVNDLRAVLAAHPAPRDDVSAEEAESVVGRATAIVREWFYSRADNDGTFLACTGRLADAGLLAPEGAVLDQVSRVLRRLTGERDAARARLGNVSAVVEQAERQRDQALDERNRARGALGETLDDLTRTLARAEKAEGEVERLNERVRYWRDSECALARGLWEGWQSRAEKARAERDRARDTAAALEAENALLTAKVERVEVLAYQLEESTCSCLSCETQDAVARDIRRALSDTTGEATPPPPAEVDCCSSGSCEVCQPDEVWLDGHPPREATR